MAVVKTVTSGLPITAGWANSLIHEVNTRQGLKVGGRAANSTSLRSIKPDNTPAWQIDNDGISYSINTGQVYINGLLIRSENETSYNQFSSCDKWLENNRYFTTDINDFPLWYILLEYPKNLNEDNIDEVVCELKCVKHGAIIPEENQEETTTNNEGEENEGEEETTTITRVIRLTEVVNGQLVLLHSGSIYITDDTVTSLGISLIEGDGIIINVDDNAYTIGLNLSLIAHDGLIINDTTIDGKRVVEFNTPLNEYNFTGNVTVNHSTQQNIYGQTINKYDVIIGGGGEENTISLIQGDGILIDDVTPQGTNIKCYKISTNTSPIISDPITFDENWFIVNNGTVTINEEALNAVIDEAVNELSVDIQVNGLLEYTDNSTGRLNAISNGTLTLNNTLDTNVTY